MYNIEIEVSASLKKFLTHYPNIYEDAKTEATNRSLDLLQRTSLEKAPYLTGNLKREIKQRYNDKMLVAGTDRSRKYAAIQDEGGVIHAKTKPYLIFKTRDGAWHRAKQVTVPGKFYFYRNAEEQKDNILKEFEKAFQKMMDKV